MALVRLDKIIADSGIATRSEAAVMIRRGSVIVDGAAAVSGSVKLDPSVSVILVNGGRVEYKRYRYIMMNKPKGYVSATEDRNEKTVIELLDSRYSNMKLFPAGRLDKDAEGFLLLTNDGDFAHHIITPSKKVNKKYFVEIDGEITPSDITAFAEGLELCDGTKCLPAELEQSGNNGAFVTLREGKYHQVKRMMAAIGKPVIYLKRIAIGGLTLDDTLMPGEYRELDDEISAIFGEW